MKESEEKEEELCCQSHIFILTTRINRKKALDQHLRCLSFTHSLTSSMCMGRIDQRQEFTNNLRLAMFSWS